MSESDSQVMLDLGSDWTLKVIRIVPEGICYGIYLILMCILFVVFKKAGLGFGMRKTNIFLLVASILLFAGSTLFLCLDVADLLRRMNMMLLDQPGIPLSPKLEQTNEAVKRLFWTEEILFIYMLSLGDSIVVWRTWAICVDRRKWVLVPIATLIGSAASAIFEMGCDIHTSWSFLNLTPTASPVGASLCLHSDIASFSLSFATNIICTLLISFQTWQYRKVMGKYLEKSRRKTQVEKLLVLLIESGFVYILLYITQAVPIYGVKLSPGGLIACNVFNAIVQQAAGIYPTLMIILVKMQKSVWDTSEVSATLKAATLGADTMMMSRTHVADTPALPKYHESGNGTDGATLEADEKASSEDLEAHGKAT